MTKKAFSCTAFVRVIYVALKLNDQLIGTPHLAAQQKKERKKGLLLMIFATSVVNWLMLLIKE
jgi:hypothetical protein